MILQIACYQPLTSAVYWATIPGSDTFWLSWNLSPLQTDERNFLSKNNNKFKLKPYISANKPDNLAVVTYDMPTMRQCFNKILSLEKWRPKKVKNSSNKPNFSVISCPRQSDYWEVLASGLLSDKTVETVEKKKKELSLRTQLAAISRKCPCFWQAWVRQRLLNDCKHNNARMSIRCSTFVWRQLFEVIVSVPWYVIHVYSLVHVSNGALDPIKATTWQRR